MIYITEEQAAKVQYLLDQAIQGNHVLFDPTIMRRALLTPPLGESVGTAIPNVEQQYAVEHHIEKLMSMDHLAIKRAYLERLDSDTYVAVVRTYFNIIENRLYESKSVAH